LIKKIYPVQSGIIYIFYRRFCPTRSSGKTSARLQPLGGRQGVTRMRVLHRRVELTGENRLAAWPPGKSIDQRMPSGRDAWYTIFPKQMKVIPGSLILRVSYRSIV
jgi:hypothetical protein